MESIKSLKLKKVKAIPIPIKIIPVKNKFTLFFLMGIFPQIGQTSLVLTNYKVCLVYTNLQFSSITKNYTSHHD